MELLIDGYNLLKTIEHIQGALSREQFITLIAAYARTKKHKILLVFDAGPEQFPIKTQMAGVTIIYSGRQQTADEAIQEVLNLYGDEKNVVLVSSDAQLKHYAMMRGATCIESALFINFLPRKKIRSQPQTAVQSKVHKITQDQEPELDRLMNLDIAAIKTDDYQEEQESRSEWFKQLAKNDKRLINILKKL